MKLALFPRNCRFPALAIAIILTGCRSSSQAPVAPTPAISIELPKSTVSRPSPASTALSNPFERGVDKAASATNLAQTAQTAEDWKLVIEQWQRAIAFMKAVPSSSPNRAAAQRLLEQYQDSLAQSQVQAKRGGPSRTVPQAADDGNGVPFIVGASPQASEPPGSQVAITIISTLNQRQSDFFAKQKRFASSLKELEGVPAESGGYTYRTTVVSPSQVISTATPRQNGQPSYTGAVVVVQGEKDTPTLATAICVTQQPAKAPPSAPVLVAQELRCPAGTKSVGAF